MYALNREQESLHKTTCLIKSMHLTASCAYQPASMVCMVHFVTVPSIKYVMAQKTLRGSALSMIRSVNTVAIKNTDTR